MALIPVHTRRPLTPRMIQVMKMLPPTWTDDGLSLFPDSIFGWDIRPAGTIHDARYCTRLWSPGWLDDDWKRTADLEIRDNVWHLLPFGLRATGYIVFAGVYRGGYGAFDSCGAKPHGATAGQLAAGLCRHGVPRPDWMPAQMAA